MNYKKNCVKLLSKIEPYEKYTSFYTEFDGNFNIGDKLYIMVIDTGSTEFVLDSFETSGYTYSDIGYKLLEKDGNKLVLDIVYNDIPTGVTSLTENNCYIGRVYVKGGEIKKGIINDTMLYNVKLQPTTVGSILWKQGIIAKSDDDIKNITFDSKDKNTPILKTEIIKNKIYTYYQSNYNLSIINLYNNIKLDTCNYKAGIFNNCEIFGNNNTISDGLFNGCDIKDNYMINGGKFINCELSVLVKWNNGRWDNSDVDAFKPTIWKNGVWEDGTFPTWCGWENGRFLNGTFNGDIWLDGQFGENDNKTDEPKLENTNWKNGIFNSGKFLNSNWDDGIFNGGVFSGGTWENGSFNDGDFSNATWKNGDFNNGDFINSAWKNGKFNNGKFLNSTWEDGDFNNGLIDEDSIWENGNFFNGSFQNSIWKNGNFYNGGIFDSTWKDGNLFFGILNGCSWENGVWFNGIANNIDFSGGTWKKGVWNFGDFLKGVWEDGSFNDGVFSGQTNLDDAIWLGGNFYGGIFDAIWSGGTFFDGEIISTVDNNSIIGESYKQYKENKLISKKDTKTRLPSKKRF